MARRNGTAARWLERRSPLVAMITTVGTILGTLLAVAGAPPAAATVTAVKGSAYGYSLAVSLFGGPVNTRGVGQVTCTDPPTNNTPPGCVPPTAADAAASPSVTLAPNASNSPQTATKATTLGQVGPAQFFSSGQIDVSTQGTLGAGGSVTSTTNIANVDRLGSEAFGYGPPDTSTNFPKNPLGLTTSISSTCTASETGVTGSTTVTNGQLELDNGLDANDNGNYNDPGDHPPVRVTVPTTPAPNTSYDGHIEVNGAQDLFRYVFNEQIVNPDGSLTVYAAHQHPIGPTAVGDLFIGKVECGVTSTGGRYTPLTPARILDTRDGTGGIVGPVGPGAVDVQVTGRGGVPSTGVSAVAMNVTVTQPTASGYLTLYPAGTSLPLAANLNFTPAKTVPNLVVVKVGTAGKVSMFNSAGNTHVIFDVAGWYSDAATGGNAGRFRPLVPARILDTRDGTGGGVRLGPGASLDMQVSGRGGVPATGVQAAVLNVAVTATTAGSWLTIYPTGEARPLAANVNFNAGDTVSNRAMVKLGSGGRVTIYNNAGSTDVVVDVGGWYTDASVVGTAGGYTPLVPARILDTRDGTGGITGTRLAASTVDVQVTGRGGVPASGVSAVILNATVTGPTAPGWLTIFPAGTVRPLTADVNYAAGETRPNLVVVQVGAGGKVSLFTSASTQVVFDVAGWFS
jgi:hypothetical protein